MLRSPEQGGRSGSDRDERALLALGRSSATLCCRGGNIASASFPNYIRPDCTYGGLATDPDIIAQ